MKDGPPFSNGRRFCDVISSSRNQDCARFTAALMISLARAFLTLTGWALIGRLNHAANLPSLHLAADS